MFVVVLKFHALAVGFIRFVRSGSRTHALLLCGPEGSGKTTMFYQLRQTPLPKGTVTSMSANEDSFHITHGQVRSERRLSQLHMFISRNSDPKHISV